MDVLTELSLFTGYGGFSLGLRLARIPVRTVCYVEIDHYRQRVIQARIRDGLLNDAPIWDDIRTFDGGPWRGIVDIITAGFPCQPHSTAGKRLGEDDERNLWPDTIRVIREIRPAFVLLENVPGITQRRRGRPAYVGRVFGDLAGAGYDAIWDSVSAAEVGAPHLRQRWWCLAYTDEQRLEEWEEQELLGQCPPPERSSLLENTTSEGLEVRSTEHRAKIGQGAQCEPERPSWWVAEPDVGRVAARTPSRVDRLAALGDGLVPPVVREFLRRYMP